MITPISLRLVVPSLTGRFKSKEACFSEICMILSVDGGESHGFEKKDG